VSDPGAKTEDEVTMLRRLPRIRARRWTGGLAALLVASCASAPKAPPAPAVYYPPAPELPRIQFLTSFSGLKDIEEQTGFDRFVLGEKQNIRLDKPYGIALQGGKIYVCDTNNTVVVFDLVKKDFRPLPGAIEQGRLIQPLNISVDDEGVKYVADPERGQIVAFDRDDAFLRAYGKPGEWRPVDAAPYGDRLYAVDVANARIVVFDKESGERLKTIGDRGEPVERLAGPTNLAFDPEGRLHVTDFRRFQIVEYDRDGHYRSALGRAGDNAGHFARPKGIAVDREGRLLAVDASFNNVQVFNAKERLLMAFGKGGEQPGDLLLPADVWIDDQHLEHFREFVAPEFEAEYLIFVTSQFGPRQVNVFAYGKQRGKRYPTDAELEKAIEERRKRELAKDAQP
jgi:hypothetical protein